MRSARRPESPTHGSRVPTVMSAMTSKVFTTKNPNMATEDSVANWGELKPVLTEIGRPYLSLE